MFTDRPDRYEIPEFSKRQYLSIRAEELGCFRRGGVFGARVEVLPPSPSVDMFREEPDHLELVFSVSSDCGWSGNRFHRSCLQYPAEFIWAKRDVS